VAFVIYFKITGMCSVLLCLHVDQPASGSEDGGSQLMKNTENLCCILFVHSWVQGKGTQLHDLDHMLCLRGASDALQK
jgi:hypothetical protein